MHSDPTCAGRIHPYYESRMATIGALQRVSEERASYLDTARLEAAGELDADGILSPDAAMERLDEMPLAVELVRVVKITLGTGGPGDWFEAMIDADGSVGRIVYHFNDWFDHAEINVSDDEDARAFCERFAEFVTA